VRDRIQTSKKANENPPQYRHWYAPILPYNNGSDPHSPPLLTLILQQPLPRYEGTGNLTLNFCNSIVPYEPKHDEDIDY
ncbi:Hypothetical predicted protein, partial [Pelobates cultripes]